MLEINLLNKILKPQSKRWGSKMKIKQIITSPWTWGVALFATAAIGIGVITMNSTKPTLEQRLPDKQEFYVKFGTPVKDEKTGEVLRYDKAQETYGLGLSVLEALEKEDGKPMTESAKLYFIREYLNTDGKDGVSPQELLNYMNGKTVDGRERSWTKGLKPVETKEDGFGYKFHVDYDPAQLKRLNEIMEKHAAIRKVPNNDKWQYLVKRWAADKFSEKNYLNEDAVDKYDAHVKKVEEALK